MDVSGGESKASCYKEESQEDSTEMETSEPNLKVSNANKLPQP